MRHALIGTHDFTAFTPTETGHMRFERDVCAPSGALSPRRPAWAEPARRGASREACSALPDGGRLLEFWIEADTFMRHMNRVLVGTMLEVAAGQRTVEEFTRLLEGRPASRGRSQPRPRTAWRSRRSLPTS